MVLPAGEDWRQRADKYLPYSFLQKHLAQRVGHEKSRLLTELSVWEIYTIQVSFESLILKTYQTIPRIAAA
jgi:hypothetical protein